MRSKRLKANFFASLSNKGVVALEQLILVPIFLSYWGAEYYGTWLVLTAIPTVLALSNLGLGSAALTRIVLSLGKNDDFDANSAMVTSCILILGIFGVVIGALILFSAVFLKSDYLIDSPLTILSLLTSSAGLLTLAEPLYGYWIARERAAFSLFIRAGLGFSRLVVVVIILSFGYKALSVAVGIFSISIVWLIVYFIMSTRLIKWQYSFEVTFVMLKKLIGKGLGFQASVLWQTILFSGSIWIANMLLGPAAAAAWGTLRTLSRAGNQLIAIVNHSIIPEFQNIVAKRNWKDARRLHSISVVISIFVSVIIAVVITIAGSELYLWWTRGELNVAPWVWFVFSIGLVFNAIWMGSEIVHIAFNQPWRINIVGVFASIIAIVVMAVFAEIISSIEGFVFGSLIFDAIMASYVLYRSLVLLQDSFIKCLQRGYIFMYQLAMKKFIRKKILD